MLTFDEYIAKEGLATTRVNDLNVKEQNPGLRLCAEDAILFWLELGMKLDGIDSGDVAWKPLAFVLRQIPSGGRPGYWWLFDTRRRNGCFPGCVVLGRDVSGQASW